MLICVLLNQNLNPVIIMKYIHLSVKYLHTAKICNSSL